MFRETPGLRHVDGTVRVAELKANQRLRIQQIGDALSFAGFSSLDEKAKALGLCRSTTWTILKADHKSTGLSVEVIMRILAAPQLPPDVRVLVAGYVEEKAAGCYGHTVQQRRRFADRLLSGKNRLRLAS